MIVCKYECACGEGTFRVRNRGEREDVLDWMEAVRTAMGEAHDRMAPNCPARTADLFIPIDADTEIGKARTGNDNNED